MHALDRLVAYLQSLQRSDLDVAQLVFPAVAPDDHRLKFLSSRSATGMSGRNTLISSSHPIGL